MSSPTFNNDYQNPSKRHSTPKGLASSFGFTMSAEIKKKMRPISTPFGMLDNGELKTIPKPNRIRPKSSINFSSNNKLTTTNLIPPTTQIDSKKDIKRKSQFNFQVKENYNYSNRGGSKIALFRDTRDKSTKELTDSSKYNKHATFSKRRKSENDTDSKNHAEDYTSDKEKNVELSDGEDVMTCSEYGYGEALAVEEFSEIKDKFKVIDKTFDSIGMSVSLRDVLIKIDDSTFETLAAAVSTPARIEDETFPVDELFNLTDSESDPDEPSICVLELSSRNSPELPPPSPTVVFFDEDYMDQLDLTFSMVHHQHEVIDEEEFDGILGSTESDDFITRGIHSGESLDLAGGVIHDEYSTINYNLFSNAATGYYQMYNIDNHETLSETPDNNDIMHA